MKLIKELLGIMTEGFDIAKWYIIDDDKIKSTKHWQSGPYDSENDANEEFKKYSTTKLEGGKLVNSRGYRVVNGKQGTDLSQGKAITEGRRNSGDLADMIEKYCDQEKMYHFEGGRGVNNFEKLIGILGYRNLDAFLEDNSGCLQSMIEWIGEQDLEEWKESFQAEIPEDEDEDKNG